MLQLGSDPLLLAHNRKGVLALPQGIYSAAKPPPAVQRHPTAGCCWDQCQAGGAAGGGEAGWETPNLTAPMPGSSRSAATSREDRAAGG